MKKNTTIVTAVMALTAAILSTSSPLLAAFVEPPAVLYGKVIHVGQGGTFQVLSGRIVVTLTSDTSPQSAVTIEGYLGPKGPGGIFSYLLEVPQKYLPAQEEMGQTLAVGSGQSQYRFTSIQIDGEEAVPLDSARTLLMTGFSLRAQEHRLDLAISLPQADSDGDGIPDWWEELHGLNTSYAGDAGDDGDGDGLTNLEEFLGGTDPAADNRVASLVTTSLLVRTGRAGTGPLVSRWAPGYRRHVHLC